MKYLVLLNGPPRVGKDTAAQAIVQNIESAVRIGMADHLKEATHAAYGLYDSAGRPLPPLYFEAKKDEGIDEFLGITPRTAYISHSEKYIKPLHGLEFFGEMFLRRAESSGADVVAMPDSGFAPEAEPSLRKIGRENALLIRIHGRGKTYSGDSRGYIKLDGVKTIDLENDVEGDTTEFLRRVVEEVKALIGRPIPHLRVVEGSQPYPHTRRTRRTSKSPAKRAS